MKNDQTTSTRSHAPRRGSAHSSFFIPHSTLGRRPHASCNKWREQFNPLRGLTIRRAIDMGEAYLRGDMASLQWTYFHIEQTDPDLLALIELRFGRLLEMDYNIKLAERAADTALAGEQQAFLQERFDTIDNLYDAIEHLAAAAFRGFAHLEKWHGSDGSLSHLEIVDQWNTVRDGRSGAWKYNPDARDVGFKHLPAENLMLPEAFLFREVARPINRFALLKFVRAGLAEKDWDAYCEIYGIPGGVLIGPPNLPKEREDEFTQAAQGIAEGGSGYAPHGSDWKPNTAARGTQPFKERLDWLSEKLVLAGTGGKLTMLNGPAGLGGGQSDVHQQVFDTIAAGEARRVSEIFNRQLVKAWLDGEYPGKPQLAYFDLAANTEPDIGAVIEHISKLSAAGFQVDEEEASEKTGYTLTLKQSGSGVPPLDPSDPSGQPGPSGQPDGDDDGGDDPDTGKLRNRAADAGREAMFKAECVARLSEARRAALAPILNRLLAIEQIADPAAQRAALNQFRDDLPALQRAALAAAPGMADTLAEIIGTALVDGAAGNADFGMRNAELKNRQAAPCVSGHSAFRTPHSALTNMSPRRGNTEWDESDYRKPGTLKTPVSFARAPFQPPTPAKTPPSGSTALCKARARPSCNS